MKYGPLYHGTEHEFTAFSRAYIGRMTGCDTHGFWFTDNPQAANFYHSGAECGGRVISAFLTMENPLRVSSNQFREHYPHGPAYWAKQARERGCDGVILSDIVDGDTQSTVYAVFFPNQIEICP